MIVPFLGCFRLLASSFADEVVNGTDGSSTGEGAVVVFVAETAKKFPSHEDEKCGTVENVQKEIKSLFVELKELIVVVELDDFGFSTEKMEGIQSEFKIVCREVDVNREEFCVDIWDV